jgi:uncharacterized sulfatase
MALLAAACARGAAPAERPPNLVLLISDDQDPAHLGLAGHPLDPTPVLDGLAERGAVFERGYTAPRCRAALAGLLSGRHPHQNGVWANASNLVLRGRNLLPQLLRRRGYRTYAEGKFWEGSPREVGFTDGPDQERGDNGLGTETFVRSDQARLFAFLEEVGDQPFFVWWAPMLPHVPHDPPPDLLARFPLEEIEVPAWIDARDELAFREAEAKSLAMAAWFDRGVGELIEKLRELEQLDRTLFVFLIDNGWANGLPSKGTPFEKGVRTPLVFSGPGVPAGSGDDRLVSYLDVMPTLLDFAGARVPELCEGESLRPVIEGAGGPPRELLCGAVYGKQAGEANRPEQDVVALWATDGRRKYVLWTRAIDEEVAGELGMLHRFAPAPVRSARDEDLYDLTTDPSERNDLSGDPSRRAEMQALHAGLRDWWAGTGGRPLGQ